MNGEVLLTYSLMYPGEISGIDEKGEYTKAINDEQHRAYILVFAYRQLNHCPA